jgi:ABC-type phosphonate transport system ATPase subunit
MSERQTPEQNVADVLLHAQALTNGSKLQPIAVMHRACVVETGLTDQVLDDAQHPYAQLLVSSVLQA